MKTASLSTAILLASALSAQALSCAPPNIARTFNWHNEAEETYVIFIGALRAAKPYTDPNKGTGAMQKRQSYQIEGAFAGQQLHTKGLADPLNFPVTINVQCLAHWCGAFSDDKSERVYFLKREEGGGFSASFGPCDGYAPDLPVADAIPILQRCMKRGKCTERVVKSLDRLR